MADESMKSMDLNYLQFTTMSHMRCAAHISQLEIRDRLKIDTIALLFIKIRRISAAARTSKTDAILKKNKQTSYF